LKFSLKAGFIAIMVAAWTSARPIHSKLCLLNLVPAISFRQVFEPKLEWSSLVQLVHSAKGAISVQHPDGWRELSGQSL